MIEVRYYFQFLIKKTWKPVIPIFTGTLLAVFLIGSLNVFPDGNLHLKFYDVGQGDSLFIKTPKGSTVLIDGGPDDQVMKSLSWDLGFFNRTIDVMILTHPHADHVTGLTAVLKRFNVRRIIFDSPGESLTFKAFISEVERQKKAGAEVYSVKSGDRIRLGETSLDILWPKVTESSTSANPNNLSIVSLLKFRDFEALLTGDQEVAEAEKMLYSVAVPNIEVLKVAHHGSKNGLSAKILSALRPEVAIISVGKNNRYGHPSPQTLKLIADFGSKLLRTDLNGTVEVITDGTKVWLKN